MDITYVAKCLFIGWWEAQLAKEVVTDSADLEFSPQDSCDWREELTPESRPLSSYACTPTHTRLCTLPHMHTHALSNKLKIISWLALSVIVLIFAHLAGDLCCCNKTGYWVNDKEEFCFHSFGDWVRNRTAPSIQPLLRGPWASLQHSREKEINISMTACRHGTDSQAL